MDFNKFTTRGGFNTPMPEKSEDAPATWLEVIGTMGYVEACNASQDAMLKFMVYLTNTMARFIPNRPSQQLLMKCAELTGFYDQLAFDSNEYQGGVCERLAKQRTTTAAKPAQRRQPDPPIPSGEGTIFVTGVEVPEHWRDDWRSRAAFVEGYRRGRAEGNGAGSSPHPADDGGVHGNAGKGEEGTQASQPGRLGNRDEGPRGTVRGARKGGADPKGDGAGSSARKTPDA